MKPFLFFTFLLLNTLCFAQGDVILNKISPTDSLDLLKTMGGLIKAIETKNATVITASCLELVNCEICAEKIAFNHPPEEGFVPADMFKIFLTDWLSSSPAWIDIKQYAPAMASASSKGFFPKSVKMKPDGYFTDFELSYTIESSSNKCIFSFVKEDEKFKIWAIRFSP
jgi:hypothetical protein